MTEARVLREAIYLAGNIAGLTYEQATGWRLQAASDLVALGYDVFSPMREKMYLAEKFNKVAIPHTDVSFRDPFQRDMLDVRRSDYVLAYFHPEAPASIGTLVELGYAYALGKYIIVVDVGGTHVGHPFVRGVANDVVQTLDDAVLLLAECRSISA